MLCFHRGRCIPFDVHFLDFLATVALFCCKSRRSALRKYPFRVLKVALLFFPLSFIMVCGCMLPLQSYVPPRCYGLMDCLPVCFLPGPRHAASIRLRPSVVCTSSFSCLFMRCFPVRVLPVISRDVYNILWCHMFVLLFLCVLCCFFCVFPEKSCRFIWFVSGKALLLHSLRW